MRVYVDCDDVITNTGDMFCRVADEMFGIRLPYERITDFNIQKSFSLSDEQFHALMFEVHEPQNLGTLEEIQGASDTLNSWVDAGHEVEIVTGRPFRTYDITRKWLDAHNLSRLKLIHVDKYGVEKYYDTARGITLDEFYTYKYDYAVEDSPIALNHLEKINIGRAAVINRPWNKESKFPSENFVRCMNWKEVADQFEDFRRKRSFS